MATPAFIKRLGKSSLATWLFGILVTFYIRFVQLTSSIEIYGEEHVKRVEHADARGYFIAFWHARLLMAPVFRKKISRRFKMLISAHRDGEIIATAVQGYGVEFIRGSTKNARKSFKNKGGIAAIAEIKQALCDGDVVGLTPDGPRGPACEVQSGLVRLATATQRPIIPLCVAASRTKCLNSWDNFQLILPFSRIVAMAGSPVWLNDCQTRNDLPLAKKKVEAAMQETVKACEAALSGEFYPARQPVVTPGEATKAGTAGHNKLQTATHNDNRP
ncbi:MAG: lysophospholipid acyltransferase family protein [Pseudomonadota bacterium]